MPINGYKIREALKRYDLRKKALIAEFEDSLHAFEGEEKPVPMKVMEELNVVTTILARLQEFQEWYNRTVEFNFAGTKTNLSLAIKLISSIDCQEKLWRKTTARPKDIWGARQQTNLTRSKEHDYAKKTYTAKEAIDAADKLASRGNALRAAIAQANAQDLPHLREEDKDLKKYLEQ